MPHNHNPNESPLDLMLGCLIWLLISLMAIYVLRGCVHRGIGVVG